MSLLPLVSGCGGGVPSLTPAEQAEVDQYIAAHGTRSLAEYMDAARGTNNEERVLKLAKYFVSKGADINVRSSRWDNTPLDNAKYANNRAGFPAVVKYLESVGAK